MTSHEDRNAKANEAMAAADLEQVHVDVDDANTYYLSGTDVSPGEEAEAVEVAFEDGADVVRDGIVVPGADKPELERYFSVGDSLHDDNGEPATPAQRILRGADLSDRVFRTTQQPLQTGTPLVTK